MHLDRGLDSSQAPANNTKQTGCPDCGSPNRPCKCR